MFFPCPFPCSFDRSGNDVMFEVTAAAERCA
jgi:hypothetical protein